MLIQFYRFLLNSLYFCGLLRTVPGPRIPEKIWPMFYTVGRKSANSLFTRGEVIRAIRNELFVAECI